MMTPTSHTLAVPGATLYYETWGAGPPLLIIPGGPQDAGVFADIARPLAAHFTVVAYDPRANSRSPAADMSSGLDLNLQGNDAAALIEALGLGPAHVFGTSGGAQIGLNLAARHPALVRTLVAHEPPTMMLLDDPSEAIAAAQSIYETYKRDGVDAAMGKFFGMNDLDPGGDDAGGEGPPDLGDMPPEAAETFVRVSGNFEYWLAHGMLPLSLYTPEVGALRIGKPHIVVAIGEGSAGQPIAEMGNALAARLGIRPETFPGDHMGFEEPHAEAFAAALRRVLEPTPA
jgi:pimeloyl-ACP methyl ester carboxylesterase